MFLAGETIGDRQEKERGEGIMGEDSPLMASGAPRLVLASASASRAALLRAAGLGFEAMPANIDEAALRESLRAEGASAQDAALALAQLKAEAISRREAGAFVIGADQILDCAGIWYEKPADLLRARDQLAALRGHSHALATAVCVVRDGKRLWAHVDAPRLVMRAFSDGFLDAYLQTVGDVALTCAGGYQLEGAGAQLFAGIEGDYFTILGLPLLALLDYLRTQGVLAS